jgi:hypothetical protein
MRPHRESGRHYYFRPKEIGTGRPLGLTAETIRRHLEGYHTLVLYSINPNTQRSKWVAIDADYPSAIEDLLKLQYELGRDGAEAALEKSKRGGHLWLFFATPALARDCRVYIFHLAQRLSLPVKGAGLPEGIEIFPRQDKVAPEEFGNAIRAPLGIHRGVNRRYWFYGADYELEAQFRYLRRLKKVTEEELARFVVGKSVPEALLRCPDRTEVPRGVTAGPGFRILDHVRATRKLGRNWVTRCPSCARHGHDRGGDNLAISIADPRKYICWAGCTREMIREAVGQPVRQWRTA